MMKYPEIGDKMPDLIALSVKEGRFKISSKTKQHPVLLYFYPMNYGKACSTYMEMLNEHHDEFKQMGIELIQVNPGSVDEHSVWMDRMGSRYDIISDKEQIISKRYGMIITDPDQEILYGFTDRGLILLDKDMIVRYLWRPDRPNDIVDIRTVIKDIQNAVSSLM